MAVALLSVQPAAAQQMRTASPVADTLPPADYLHPIESDLGMPVRAGEVNIRARAGMPTAGNPTSTFFGLNAGLSEIVTLEMRAPFLVLGGPAGLGYFSGFDTGVQVGVYRDPRADFGLSLSVSAEMPGGPGGFNLAGVQPVLGLRSRATIGPMQGHLNLYGRPMQNSLSWQLASMWQITPNLAPGFEFVGTGGNPGSISFIPEVKVRAIQNLALGFGYQVPLFGAPGQMLAQAELLF